VVDPVDPEQLRPTEKVPPLDWTKEWDDSLRTTRIPADVHDRLVADAKQMAHKRLVADAKQMAPKRLVADAKQMAPPGYFPPARPPRATSVPICEVPETIPPPAGGERVVVVPSPSTRLSPVERAALRLAWVMLACTVILAAAILAAAWGR
jgi:hypothetical protein